MLVDCRRDYDGRQKHILQFDLAFLKTLEFRNVLWCSIGTQKLCVFTIWKTLGFVELDANGLKELSKQTDL